MSQRVTLKMIAEKCNVSVATVSYALRNSSHISESTRAQVHSVAQQLGYRPDPSLSSLASSKKRIGQTPFYASVGILHPNPEDSRATRLFNEHARHFKQQMEAFGCSVTDFQVDSNRYSPERLAQILRTRGIRGLLLGWGDWPENFDHFPWDEFTVISTLRTTQGSNIDKVTMNHFHALDEIFQRLEVFPETRYGLILHDDCPPIIESQILGAYHANMFERSSLASNIPPYYYHLNEGPARLQEWYHTHRPEVVISHRVIDPDLFEKAGIHFPMPTRLVVMEIDEPSRIKYSGFYTEGELGRTAATLLARRMRNDEVKCKPRRAKLTLVNGVWHDGATIHK